MQGSLVSIRQGKCSTTELHPRLHFTLYLNKNVYGQALTHSVVWGGLEFKILLPERPEQLGHLRPAVTSLWALECGEAGIPFPFFSSFLSLWVAEIPYIGLHLPPRKSL